MHIHIVAKMPGDFKITWHFLIVRGNEFAKIAGGTHMKLSHSKRGSASVDMHKVVMIRTLLAIAIAITLSGALFTGYSLFTGTSFRVFNAPLSGALFGMMVVYFGVRSILSVRKLRAEVYEKGATFSWNNFKKQRPAK